MPITLHEPSPRLLGSVVGALREWQRDGAPVQLHPGDLGWFERFGAAAAAAATRTWNRGDSILAVGLLDGPGLVRLAIAPHLRDDDELALRLSDDVSRTDRGVLPSGPAAVESRSGDRFRSLLLDGGWVDDEPWTPLSRDLGEPVERSGLRIDVLGPGQVAQLSDEHVRERVSERAAVQRAAFPGSTFSAERWRAMADGSAYADGRCLVAYDDTDTAVAAATVWSAGPGRPGLLEPVGVHPGHRGHGYGTAISVAAASVLRDLGSSSASVCTETSNVAAVATYRAAGFREHDVVRDLRRIA